MIFDFANTDKQEPLYILLAREIRNEIESGVLSPGERMPTVRDMCIRSGLSAGTVRQAYGLLQSEGLIELTPGRGTFVSLPKESGKSRKARAMDEIDRLFISLSQMGFTQAEAKMLLSLRLAQMDQDQYTLPAALISESPEALRCAFEKLTEISNIDLSAFSMDEIRSHGAIALTDFPLVLVQAPLVNEVSAILRNQSDALCPFALSVSHQTLFELSRIPENASVLIYGESDAFYRLVKRTIKSVSLNVTIHHTVSGSLLESDFSGITHMIIAPDTAAFAPENERSLILNFSQKLNKPITFDLMLDEGSMIVISRRADALNKKRP